MASKIKDQKFIISMPNLDINFKEIAEATRNQLIFQIKLIVYITSTIDLYLI